jgi:hypothetical protein
MDGSIKYYQRGAIVEQNDLSQNNQDVKSKKAQLQECKKTLSNQDWTKVYDVEQKKFAQGKGDEHTIQWKAFGIKDQLEKGRIEELMKPPRGRASGYLFRWARQRGRAGGTRCAAPAA